MNKYKKFVIALAYFLLAGLGLKVIAEPITQFDGFNIQPGRVGMLADTMQLRSVGGTGILTLAYTPDTSVNSTVYLDNVAVETFQAKVSPAGGAAAANATTYYAYIYPGHAGTVQSIRWATNVNPISGTNTIQVNKGSSAGASMLSTATVSLNGATSGTIQSGTLTATPANLSITATQGIYCAYVAGTQGAAAQDVTVFVDFNKTDEQ